MVWKTVFDVNPVGDSQSIMERHPVFYLPHLSFVHTYMHMGCSFIVWTMRWDWSSVSILV